MEKQWQALNTIIAEIIDILRAGEVLSWDQQTYMPASGASARAEQLAVLQRLAHERITSKRLGDLLTELEEQVDESTPLERRAILREARRLYDLAVRIPPSLVEELARVTSVGMAAWVEARKANRFELFAPHLERIVALTRDKAETLGYDEHPYDALLDEFEPGAKRDEVDALFAELRAELVPLLQEIVPRMERVDDVIFRQRLGNEEQMAFVRKVLADIGFDMDRGRLDLSEHPFTISFSPADVRLTTRIDPDDLRMALYSGIHEAGHGMYEQGLPASLDRTIVGSVPSLAWHESQSRLWENVIGRSRSFWQYFLPLLRESFPGKFDGVDLETVYRAVNRVEPSLIRTEADEVTYNLHIMLRYELEQALVSGDLAVSDLPGAWDDKMEEYIGVRPPSVVEGVLQDVHWSHGLIGYFPTYTLGTVLAVQLYDVVLGEHPELPDEIAKGNFVLLRDWMQKNVYQHGSLYTPKELVRKVTGSGIVAKPYLTYIKEKYAEVYGI